MQALREGDEGGRVASDEEDAEVLAAGASSTSAASSTASSTSAASSTSSSTSATTAVGMADANGEPSSPAPPQHAGATTASSPATPPPTSGSGGRKVRISGGGKGSSSSGGGGGGGAVVKHHTAKGLVMRPGEVEMFVGEILLRVHPAFDVASQLAGRLLLTSFRILFLPDQPSHWYGGVQRVPLGSIFRVKNFDRRDRSSKSNARGNKNAQIKTPHGFHVILCLKCKGFCASRYFRELIFALDTREDRHAEFHSAMLKRTFPANVRELFAFTFRPPWEKVARWSLYDPHEEFQRQGIFNPCSQWRLSTVNENFSICPTYPGLLVVPKTVDDETITKVAEFRSKGRLPVLSYKHVNQAAITRSAQPMVGLTGSRSAADESLLKAIFLSNPHGGKLQILDARPKVNAVANTAAGAGYENPKQYPFIEQPQFLGIPNIHVCRDAYKKLRTLCKRPDDPKWAINLEATGWLELVRLLLQSAVLMTELVDKYNASILCHCSDGWDRTSQLVSLSMMMLDEYYRTLRYSNKEWINFGHKFGERTGHGHPNYSHDQRGPVFLHFIDACYQLLQQFPTSFQFNSNLLIFLLDALYSCQFGNFLCDNEKERDEMRVSQETMSIWTYIFLNQAEFINVFYRSNPHVLIPNCTRARMVFWSEYYLRWSSARPQYLCDQQHLVPAGEAYQLFAVAPRSSASAQTASTTAASSSATSSPGPALRPSDSESEGKPQVEPPAKDAETTTTCPPPSDDVNGDPIATAPNDAEV